MILEANDIEFEAILGDLPRERSEKQRLRVDLRLETADAAAQSDNLADTVDYAAVVEAVRQSIESGRFRLVEAAARAAAECAAAFGGVMAAAAKVTKFASVPFLGSASAEYSVSRGAATPAAALVEKLKKHSLVCATAESCTGGGIGKAITAVPGSSDVFAGGIISYANEVKAGVLGVRRETLEEFGAVSSQCAAEMAKGALALTKADLAVSVTGIAGPGGGTPEKPVGTVWFGLASAATGTVRTEMRLFAGDRAAVRAQSVEHAIALLSSACPEP